MSDGIVIPAGWASTDDAVAWVWSDSHIDAGWATHHRRKA